MDYPYLECESDLGVDAQIEQLAREKDAKLPGLKMLEGVDPQWIHYEGMEELEMIQNVSGETQTTQV